MSPRLRTPFALAATLLAACRYPATELMVRVDSDLTWGPGRTLTEVRLTVWTGSVLPSNTAAMPVLSRTFPLGTGANRFVLPGTQGLQRVGSTSAPVTVEAVALHDGVELLRTRAIAQFTDRQNNLLELFLAGRCRFEAQTCQPDQSCGRNGCEPLVRATLPPFAAQDASGLEASASADASGPEAPVTRPLAPLSTATAPLRPTLRWVEGRRGGAPASVLLCRDRALRAGCVSLPASGSSAQPATELAEGAWFWQLQGLAEGFAAPVWELFASAHPRTSPRATGTLPDLDGDGLAELLVASADQEGQLRVYAGARPAPSSTARWSLAGPSSGSQFGASVDACDVDGDGYAELLVGAPGAQRVYTFSALRGGSANLVRGELASQEAGDGFGASIAALGDVDGDGYCDVAVGAPQSTRAAGRVYLFAGGPAGLGPGPTLMLDGPTGSGLFGAALAGGGDFDGDGYADLAVGENNSDDGAAWLFSGTATGLRAATPLSIAAPSTGSLGLFGASLATAGDVDGDGYPELLVGASRVNGSAGAAYVFRGGATGLSPTPAFALAGRDGSDAFHGYAVAGAGDMDGDGYAELAVGAYGVGSSAGVVYLYRGGATGPSAMPSSLVGMNSSGEFFGHALAGPGDANGDGYPELLVGATGANSGRGAAYLFAGARGGLSAMPSLVLPGPEGYQEFGAGLALRRPVVRGSRSTRGSVFTGG